MSFFTETMTVFNYIRETKSWQRSIIRGIQWSHDVRRVAISDGTVTYAREESISIDFMHDYGNPEYVEPQVFEALADKRGYWTLNCLDKKDVIVLGEAEECTEGSVMSFVRGKYAHFGNVTEVSDNRNRPRLKHIEVIVRQ